MRQSLNQQILDTLLRIEKLLEPPERIGAKLFDDSVKDDREIFNAGPIDFQGPAVERDKLARELGSEHGD